MPLLRTLGRGWGALQEVLLVSCWVPAWALDGAAFGASNNSCLHCPAPQQVCVAFSV